MAMPIAVPRIEASASGVSKQRRSPNSAASPSVIRKTPPSSPTSSPNTTTRSSAASASRRAVFSALAKVTVVRGAAAGAGPAVRTPPAVSLSAAVAVAVGVMSLPRLVGRHALLDHLPLRAQLRRRRGVYVFEQLGRVDLRLAGQFRAHPRGVARVLF